MKAIIYAHKNKINSKVYIGQTVQEISKRWRPYCYKTCTKFYNAILKYGWDNFEHIILEECDSSIVDEREQYWIEKYNSIKEGYNILKGGRTDLIWTRSSELIPTRKVICLNTLKIYNSITEAEKETGATHICNVCKKDLLSSGTDENGYGLVWRYLEEYDKEEQVIFRKQNRKKSRVLCLNTNIEYESSMAASRATKVDNGSLNKCLNGIRKSAGKDKNGKPLVWIYAEERNSENAKKNIKYWEEIGGR